MWKLLLFFTRFYSPGRFLRFLSKTKGKLHFLPKLLAIFVHSGQGYAHGPGLVLMGAIGYVILPIDIVPDILPVAGWIDDAAVVAAALKFAAAYIKPSTKKKYAASFPLPAVTGEYSGGRKDCIGCRPVSYSVSGCRICGSFFYGIKYHVLCGNF